jgi:excisionase family DNA binding protein
MTTTTTIDAPTTGEEPMLRLQDVCQRLNLKRAAVRRLMREQGLRYIRLGRDLRFKREWLEDFIEKTGTPADPIATRRRRG